MRSKKVKINTKQKDKTTNDDEKFPKMLAKTPMDKCEKTVYEIRTFRSQENILAEYKMYITLKQTIFKEILHSKYRDKKEIIKWN